MSPARDAVLAVMQTHGTPLCATCLGQALGLARDLVSDALEDLELRSDALVGMGVCGECGELQQLVWPRQAA
jgi:hypothetical protein